MARKTKTYRVQPYPDGRENRDQGKVFLIQEMPAMQAEKWAMKALLAVSKSGMDLGDMAQGGMQTIMLYGIAALLRMNFAEAEPLLEEMLDCVQFVPDPMNRNSARELWPEDIEEIWTLVELRREVLELHMGFSLADGPWKKKDSQKQQPLSEGSQESSSSSTPISQEPSAQS